MQKSNLRQNSSIATRSLASQWGAVFEANKALVLDNIRVYAVEAERPKITKALLDHIDLSDSCKAEDGQAYVDYVKSALNMSIEEYDLECIKTRQKLLDSTMPARELATRAMDVVRHVDEHEMTYKVTGIMDSDVPRFKEGLRIRSNINSVRQRLAERVKAGRAMVHAIAQRFEGIDGSMNRLARLEEEVVSLKKKDITEPSLQVANSNIRLKSVERELADISYQRRMADGTVTDALMQLKRMANKFDHGITMKGAPTLSGFVDDPASILASPEAFMDMVRILKQEVEQGRYVRDDKEKGKVLAACARIIDTEESGQLLMANISSARELRETESAKEGELTVLKESIARASSGILARDAELRSLHEKMGDIKLKTEAERSGIVEQLRQYGIELRIEGSSMEVLNREPTLTEMFWTGAQDATLSDMGLA
ncbi:MAG: hypothetical protein KGH66_02765 [Candidatus Micrarchaeota archaeon]|nr:hypothetical protein [Candidatus Micrarchaeota archaeon]